MSDAPTSDAVQRLLRLIADKLEDFLDGDEIALETLGESIEQDEFSAEDLQAAILAVRSLGTNGFASGWIADAPGEQSQRVLSAEERASLSTEAWGYLIDLKRTGSLDSDQFERVIETLTGSGVQPVGVDLAREVAARVALDADESDGTGEGRHGDIDLAH